MRYSRKQAGCILAHVILPTLIEAQTDDEFVQRGTDMLADGIVRAVNERGACILGLSGGSTPRAIYGKLGARGDLPWDKVWIFLVDERYVPPTSDDGNAKLIADMLIVPSGIAESHVIRPDTSLPLKECAGAYHQSLTQLFDEHGPPDIVTLGLGEDGHIASLFPPLPEDAFGPNVVIHTTTDRFAIRDRISLTLPTLRSTPHVFFFLKGEGKRKVWQEMLTSKEGPQRWPAKHVMGFGQTTVLLAP